jgi:hypothetical protein
MTKSKSEEKEFMQKQKHQKVKNLNTIKKPTEAREGRLIKHPSIYVAKSPIDRYGVFTEDVIEKGEIIEECVIPYELIATKNRVLIYYRFPYWKEGRHSMPLGFAAVFNNSDTDEANIHPYFDIKRELVVFESIKRIEPGEELLWKYTRKVLNK